MWKGAWQNALGAPIGCVVCAVVERSIPLLSSPLYQGLFMSAQSAKVQAIAAAGRYFASRVAVANFSCSEPSATCRGLRSNALERREVGVWATRLVGAGGPLFFRRARIVELGIAPLSSMSGGCGVEVHSDISLPASACHLSDQHRGECAITLKSKHSQGFRLPGEGG